MTRDRVEDFRSTIKEIVEVEKGNPPRDFQIFDNNNDYGKLNKLK